MGASNIAHLVSCVSLHASIIVSMLSFSMTSACHAHDSFTPLDFRRFCMQRVGMAPRQSAAASAYTEFAGCLDYLALLQVTHANSADGASMAFSMLLSAMILRHESPPRLRIALFSRHLPRLRASRRYAAPIALKWLPRARASHHRRMLDDEAHFVPFRRGLMIVSSIPGHLLPRDRSPREP